MRSHFFHRAMALLVPQYSWADWAARLARKAYGSAVGILIRFILDEQTLWKTHSRLFVDSQFRRGRIAGSRFVSTNRTGVWPKGRYDHRGIGASRICKFYAVEKRGKCLPRGRCWRTSGMKD